MNPETLNEVLLIEQEVAPILRVSIRTLQKWRVNGKGPPFIRVSARAIRYRRSDLDAWVRDRLRSSTTDDGACRN